MIKLSCFLPTNHLEELSPHLDYDFLEPVRDERYVNFYKSRDTYKLLDNGMIEFKGSVDMDTLVDYAKVTRATQVVPPDKLGDWAFNYSNALSLSAVFHEEDLIVTLAGPSPLHFLDQATWCDRKSFGGVALPYRRNRIPVPSGRQHLFGLRIPEHFEGWMHPALDVTLDTTEPIAAAMRDISWRGEGGLVSFPRPKDYIERRMTQVQISYAIDNIHYLKEWIAVRSK